MRGETDFAERRDPDIVDEMVYRLYDPKENQGRIESYLAIKS